MIAVLKAVGLNKPLIHGHIGVSIAAVQSVNCLWLEEKELEELEELEELKELKELGWKSWVESVGLESVGLERVDEW